MERSFSAPAIPVIELTPGPNGSISNTDEEGFPLETSSPDLSRSRTSLKHSMSVTHRRASMTPSSQDIISIHVDRPIFTQEDFDEDFSPKQRHSKTVKERVKNSAANFKCNPSCVKRFLFSVLPFLPIMRDYSVKEDLVNDLIAGLTVGVMHIPQGLAYGMLALIPPVHGLYTSFFPVLIYFFFGTSKHVSMGTFAVISLMVGSAVTKFDDICSSLAGDVTTIAPNVTDGWFTTGLPVKDVSEHPDVIACKVGVAAAVTFTAGLIQFGMGLLRLGFVTIYLSEPLTRAFTTGAAMHVFTSQVKHVFGISTDNYSGPLKLIYTYIDFFKQIPDTNVASIIISIICMAVLFVTKEFINPIVKKKIKMPIPIELFVVIIGTVASTFGNFRERFQIKVAGDIPTGLPLPTVPDMSRVGSTVPDAIGAAIVAFAISVSMAKLFGKKNAYEVDSNQELVAYGICNVVSSFFGCFISSASLSRSLVQENVGGRTQLAGVISSILVLIVLLALGPYFAELPNACLASIIIIALKGMFLQFKDLVTLWKIDKHDFLIWLVTFTAAVILDVDLGLMVGVIFSLLTVIFRTQRPHTCVLGRLPHTDIYKDVTVYNSVQEVDGIKIFRFEASLLYANLEHFTNKLFKKTGVNPRVVKLQRRKLDKKRLKLAAKKQKEVDSEDKDELGENQGDTEISYQDLPIHTLILDCTTMGYIDSAGVSTLLQVIIDYNAVGVSVYLAGCKASVRQLLETGGFYDKLDRNILCLSIHDAVVMALEKDPDLLHQALEFEKMSSFDTLDTLATWL